METLTPTTTNSKEGPTNDFHHHLDDDDDSELELGLSLGCSGGGGGGGGGIKFLTAQDLPSLGSHGLTFSSRTHQAAIIRPQLSSISGYKRAADHHHDAPAMASSPPALSQVVGWPPVGSYRMNNLANQTRSSNPEDGKINGECGNKKMNNGGESKVNSPQENPYLGFVKVNMDGVQIGRKLDLNAHSSYESLAQAIEEMFFRPSSASLNSISGEKDQQGKASKLLDGSSEFVLTYEDKEGDWMLVGDVPFRMFLGTVKRLRIMRTSEANGLAPRSQERSDRLRSKPI